MMARQPTAEELSIIGGWLLDARQVAPYFGRGLAALTPIVVPGLQTVAVDRYWRIYLDTNPDGWLGVMDPVTRAHLIADHELCHLIYQHYHRLVGCDPHTINTANDLAINQPEVFKHLPAGGVTPSSFGLPDGLTSEQYYDLVESMAIGGPCVCGSGAGNPQPFELNPPSAGGPDGLDEVAVEALLDGIASDVHKAKDTGNVSGRFAIWADARIAAKAPTISWQQHLAIAVSATTHIVRGRGDTSWARLNTRPAPTLRPGAVGHRPRVGVIVDVSGSMGNAAAVVVPELERLCSVAGDVMVVQVDAATTMVTTRMPRAFYGGGGTDLRVGFTALAGKKIDLIVVLTDGETPWPDSWSGPPVIVVTVGAPGPGWAKTIHVPL